MTTRYVHASGSWRASAQLESSEREGGWLRLAALLEPETMEKLCKQCGGTRIYIPRTMRPDALLSQSIGSEACCRVIAKSAGERIYIPKDGRFSARKRRWQAEVVALHAKGFSAARIARRLGCSERLVYKIVARNR
jgi:hypothetical protein